MAEKTLLQQIRERELLLNIKIEDARKEADGIILTARKEAAEMIETSEKAEDAAARIYQEKEMEKIKKEIEELRSKSNQQTILVREAGDRNLPQAVEKIVKAVSKE